MRDSECVRHTSYLKVVEAVKEFNTKLTNAVSEHQTISKAATLDDISYYLRGETNKGATCSATGHSLDEKAA